MLEFLTAKPVLIGLHLGFAIIGIDGFLWLLGELSAMRTGGSANPDGGWASSKRKLWAAGIGTVGFILSWLIGGYYYVKFYGTLVKPVILKGLAPWAHAVVMETKEHVFLFLVPMAVTAFFIAMLDQETFERLQLKRIAMWLVALIAVIGLTIGLMGFIISAAARFG